MSYQPKGYGKAGRPSKKQTKELTKRIRDIKFAKAILESNNLTDAYLKTHPKSSKKNASINVYRIITPEVVEELRRVLDLEKLAETNKATLEKILHIIMAKWLQKDEKTADVLRAIEILTKLVPEFKERIGVEDLSTLPESEIDGRLRRLGIDPNVALN